MNYLECKGCAFLGDQFEYKGPEENGDQEKFLEGLRKSSSWKPFSFCKATNGPISGLQTCPIGGRSILIPLNKQELKGDEVIIQEDKWVESMQNLQGLLREEKTGAEITLYGQPVDEIQPLVIEVEEFSEAPEEVPVTA